MKNKDQLSSGITSKKEKTINIIVFVLLSLGAVVMIFPFFYMIMTSFMTKNQYLSGQLRVIPDPWVWGKYSEVMAKGNFISGILNTGKRLFFCRCFFGKMNKRLKKYCTNFSKQRLVNELSMCYDT